MSLCYFAVKDVVAGQFGNLFSAVRREQAIRDFRSACARNVYASDLQLYKVGVFDNETGEFVPCLEFIESGVQTEVINEK